jgi:two-component system, OmpR family, sensor histidine kinase VicK
MEGTKQFPNQQFFFQAVFEHSVEAIIINDNRLVEVNSAACKLLGVTREELLGKLISNWFDFPLEAELAEIQWQQADGSSKTLQYSRVQDLLPNYHLLVFRDISKLQRATAEELAREHQRVELFAEVTLKIRQSLQLEEILRTAVTEVQSILQADRVLIYQVFANGTGMPIKEAVLPDYPPILGVEFPEEVFPADYRQLYTRGRVQAIADVHNPEAGLAECLIEFMDEWMIQAKLVVPILQNFTSQSETESDHLWGLLIAHQCQAPRQWTEFELELMQQLANQIGIALSQAEFRGISC